MQYPNSFASETSDRDKLEASSCTNTLKKKKKDIVTVSFTFSWGHAHIHNQIAQVYPQPLKYLFASSFILNNPWTNNS